MKIAIPVENTSGLDAPICEHFGRSPYFAIVTLKEGEAKIDIFANPSIEHSVGMIPEILAGYGVKKVIAGRIGEKAKFFFDQFGIEIETGTTGTLQEVIEKFLKEKD
ncbi:NifB/NifX family molybdenum-iron cluster-binding protein [Desulfurobacterium crinifex]